MALWVSNITEVQRSSKRVSLGKIRVVLVRDEGREEEGSKGGRGARRWVGVARSRGVSQTTLSRLVVASTARRQMGQVEFSESQRSMQCTWYSCEQGSLRSLWP